MIVRRNGEDLAAVIPLEYLELMREVIERQEVEKQAAQIDWSGTNKALRPHKRGSMIPTIPSSLSRNRNRDLGSSSSTG